MLDVLWTATSVAVVGASTRPGTPGHNVLTYLQRFGYAGRIVPVNPKSDQVLGLRSWPSLAAYRAETGQPVDLAVILVPAAASVDAVRDCAVAGVAVAIVGSSGFAEVDDDGRKLQDQLVAIARAHRMRLVGPNCIGAVGPESGLVASFSPLFGGAETALRPMHAAGGVGFASASGALGFGTVSLALDRGMSLRAAVSTGNEADVSALEVLAALATDERCHALLGYAESLSDPAGLRNLARAAAAHGKPIAMLVGGVSEAGARAAASHTGALATGERVVDGVLRQFGIVRVRDVDELLDVGDAFALVGPGRHGDRIAVVTTSGGSGILATDAIAEQGLRLAELGARTKADLAEIVPAYGSVANPVDVTATVMSDRTLVRRALHAVAGDDAVDMVVVCFCVLVGGDVDAIVSALAEVKQRYGKPVLVARTGAEHLAPEAAAALRAAGIPSYVTPGRAVRAAAALHRGRPVAAAPDFFGLAEPADDSAPPAIVEPPGSSEAELKAALAAAGIRVPYGTVVTSADDAVAACRRRSVFKVVAPGLLHKTDAGGVILGIEAAAAAEAYHRLMAVPGATAVLVEEQVEPGVELLLGIADSPLGRVISLGVGGVLTEVVDDVAIRLLPVTERDVRDMIASTRVARMLAGVRGSAPAQIEALVELVLRVADLAASWPGDLDLNPVVATRDGAIVLDAALSRRAMEA